jgi:hypothetical protein
MSEDNATQTTQASTTGVPPTTPGASNSPSSTSPSSPPNGDWRSSLPEEIKNHKSIQTTKSVESLAKQFLDQQSYIGGSLRIPSAEAGEADWKSFYEKVTSKVPGLIVRPDVADATAMEAFYTMAGRPAKPEDYAIDGIESDILVDGMREAAHKVGISQSQFKELIGVFPKVNEQLAAANESKAAERKAEIKKVWGAAVEDNTTQALAVAIKTEAPPELIEAVKNGEANIATLKWLHALSKSMGVEGANLTTDPNRPNVPMTPDEARSRITEIRNNPKHPVWNVRDPMHAKSIEDWVKLHKYANAG